MTSENLLNLPLEDIRKVLGYSESGLSEAEANRRLVEYGFNEVAREKPKSSVLRLWKNVKNPLVILLTLLSIISLITGDIRSTIVIVVMVILGIILRYVQETRADKAAEKLKEMVSTCATVRRDGKDIEIPLKLLVPGDVVKLGAGNMVPADVRLMTAKDLFLNQAALTGESLPVEKNADPGGFQNNNPLDACNVCFLGSNVESGTATAIVLYTGDKTNFGSLAAHIVGQEASTSFDTGINKFTWLMIRFIVIMVPAVFLINGLSRHNWLEAFLFAMAVAVGLTPEMLPMIVTVNLSKGALAMAKKKVIVKRLNAIQNFGAMDILCTDKTGTLTQGKIILEQHIDPNGNPSSKVLDYGYLNSYFQTGMKNLMDEAILEHEELEAGLGLGIKYRKIDELPFDFNRKRMSVIVEDKSGLNLLVCKGAAEGVLELCSNFEINELVHNMLPVNRTACLEKVNNLNSQGFRVVALAYKTMPGATDEPLYEMTEESGLTLLGFLAFLDPPKETAREALERLEALKLEVKILTGDNEVITAYICKQVGLPADHILLGPAIEKMNDAELADAVGLHSVFARLVPVHKQRIIKALQSKGHVTGFMGDGINDAPALKVADVSISVNSAVDIAKESSDIILLENSLLVLQQGVLEGRKIFGNIIKYIKMAASSNFGNMFSVVGASAFLPYLPMLPIQVLTNNLLYDFSQTTIPTDHVDSEWLIKPRKWDVAEIRKFILFIGPISSVFDYITFYVLWHFFGASNNPALFHTGWFVESVFTQTLIIHIIRTNKIPFIESRASWPLIISSILIAGIAVILPFSPLAGPLGFVKLPATYWVWLAGILLIYLLVTQLVKKWFIRKYSQP